MTISKSNTAITHQDGVTRVILHKTAIVTDDRGDIALDTGGWFTAVTKKRMNEVLGDWKIRERVIQHKGKWYVGIPSSDSETWTAFTGNTATIYREDVTAVNAPPYQHVRGEG